MRNGNLKRGVAGLMAIMGVYFFCSNQAIGQSYQSWYNTAQERIDTLRKGDFKVQIFDKNDNPYNGQVRKTGGIDHHSPVCNKQSVFIRISKSLFIDIEILTIRY